MFKWRNFKRYSKFKRKGLYQVIVTDQNNCTAKLETMIYTIFEDTRDREYFKTIKIEDKIWFAENIQSIYNNNK